ncbi:NADPH2:quinone reductase [Rhizobiales bacterium GAS113]|jgi:NADPH2:quinone reductase|nr:NADPH2:quinone reductase [Rhizobiales bacterium GAS113]SED83019.1 NADPH2:quinone reductase [Rhizobiales bacterium GAS188]
MGALPQTMRAWRSLSRGTAGLAWAEAPCPSPAANEALLRVEAAALNFSDLLMIDDAYQVRPPRPFVPGQEIAGRVVAAGPQSGLEVGARVASKVLWGGFAEYALVRGDMALSVPDTMPLERAAALPVVYMTALVALTESTKVKAGDTVLVLAAAGGVGLASVEIAKHLGARVIAAAGGEDKLALARRHGADATVDYREAGWSATIKELTSGRGVDVIVDPVGGPATQEALRALAWEGRLLVIGFSSGVIAQIPANRLLLKRASAIGVYWDHDRDAAMLARLSAELARLAGNGALDPHIGARFPMAELPQALASLAARQITGKAVLTLADEDRHA